MLIDDAVSLEISRRTGILVSMKVLAGYEINNFHIFHIARLAQLAERKALNLVVVGSTPTSGGLFCSMQPKSGSFFFLLNAASAASP